jgi:hypothetical protein
MTPASITSSRVYRDSIAAVALGAAVAIYGIRTVPERTWPNLLLNGFYLTSVAVSSMFFLASQRLAGARWSAGLRRIPEAFMLILPAAAGLMLVLFFGRHWIYSRSLPSGLSDAHANAGRLVYLQAPFVFGRMALALLAWSVFAWLFRSASLRQDREWSASLECHYLLNRYSAAFVVVFAFSFSLGCYDWLMSLDPSWSTTMFAVYVFAGTFVQGIAAISLAAVLLSERGYLRQKLSEGQVHDLSKMLFAFSTFWAYIWVCQYLLIWYANIPDEVTFYLKRTTGPWLRIFWLTFGMNWIVPFAVLLPKRTKCNPAVLGSVSALLLCGHWLDLYVLIAPAFSKTPKFGLPELATALGYAGLGCVLFLHNLAKAQLTPLNDPILAAEGAQPMLQATYGEETT